MANVPLNVFLVDDDVDDREFFEAACNGIDLDVMLKTFEHGESLIDYFEAKNDKPHMLFMDINMPKKNGFECLKDIRKRWCPDELCVIMYSTSNSQRDISKCYQLGANGFIQKPYSFTGLKDVLHKIFDTDWTDPCNKLDELNFVLLP